MQLASRSLAKPVIYFLNDFTTFLSRLFVGGLIEDNLIVG